MARTQTKSGGFIQDSALSYPVYAEIENSAVEVSAVLNTGPSFDGGRTSGMSANAVPVGYSSWADGPHIVVFPDSLSLTVLTGTVTVDAVIIGISGQADGDIVRRKKRRGRIYTIIIEATKKVIERPMPLRKKRKKLAKLIAEEVLPEAGGLLAADKLLLELMIRRQLEQIPLTQMHTEAWYQLQDQLMQVITDAEQTAQKLRAEAEEEDDLLLLLTS